VVVVLSASVLMLLLMLFGFVSRESAITHKRERASHERGVSFVFYAAFWGGIWFLGGLGGWSVSRLRIGNIKK
jgi:hypothetical protein